MQAFRSQRKKPSTPAPATAKPARTVVPLDEKSLREVSGGGPKGTWEANVEMSVQGPKGTWL